MYQGVLSVMEFCRHRVTLMSLRKDGFSLALAVRKSLMIFPGPPHVHLLSCRDPAGNMQLPTSELSEIEFGFTSRYQRF